MTTAGDSEATTDRTKPGKVLRAGVVGLGWAGRQHLEAYQELDGVKVVALAGLERDQLRELGDTYAIEHLAADWHEIINDVDLDVISIATPPSLHAPVAIAALNAGIDVLSEKPMASDAPSARDMAAAARANGRVLEVMFNHRRRPEIAATKRLVEDGSLGRIYYVKTGWLKHHGIPGLGSWFTRPSSSGGGPMMDIGVHMLDIALDLLGEPQAETVTASTYAEFGPRGRGEAIGTAGAKTGGDGRPIFEVEDLATAFIRNADGSTIVLDSSWVTGIGHDDMYVSVFGTEGGCEIQWNPSTKTPATTFRVWTQTNGLESEIHPTLGDPGRHVEGVSDFLQVVRSGRTEGHQGELGLARSEVIDGIYRSAATRSEVNVEPAHAK